MTSAIEVRGLTKAYGRITAVDRLDLTVPEGSRFGFLGPNGSGKTTTVRMLLGLVYPTAGHIEVLGRSMPGSAGQVLGQVGALVEGPAFPAQLPGRVALGLLDAAGRDGPRRTRAARVAEALGRVGLDDVDSRPVRAYSLGMRQRLGLAAALLRQPRLLVLDEPTNGLDPQGIREIRELLAELNQAGTTVFLSSHLLAEVQGLCSHVAVIDRSRLVVADTVASLLAPTGRVHLVTTDRPAARAVLGRAVVGATDDHLVIEGIDGPQLAVRCVAAGIPVVEMSLERASLEDVFVGLTSPGADRRSRA